MKRARKTLCGALLAVAAAAGLFAGTAMRADAMGLPVPFTAADMPADAGTEGVGNVPVGIGESGALNMPGIPALPGMLRSVYTNEPVTIEQALQRPIAVMMPTDKTAQPSYGIGNAAILYEIMEEGNISRQMAVIPDWQGLPKIGNIRSCRSYYIPAAKEWDSILIHFGGVCYMKGIIDAPDMNNLSGTVEYGVGGQRPGSGYFFRSTDRKAPHNAYISADGVRMACAELGYQTTLREEYYNAKHFTFAEGVNTLEQYGAGAAVANTIDLAKVFGYTKSSLQYDETSGLYLKSLHGKPQTDALTGNQLAFANVIVQNTTWQKADDKGYLLFQMLDSAQDGYYFTKGKAIHIRWIKLGDYEPTRYYDDAWNEIALNEGKTYIAVAQAGRAVKFY